MKKALFFLMAMALFGSAELMAQEAPALPFVTIDRSAISSAMGGTQANQGLYNPAVVPFRGSDVAFSFQSWAPGGAASTNLNLLAGIKAGKRIGINVIAAYQNGKEYTIYDNTGNGKNTFAPSDLLVGAGFGFAFTDFLAAGINVKYATSTVAQGISYGSVMGDVLVTFSMKGLKATAGVANLGMPIKSGESSFKLPTSAKVGVAYDFSFGKSGLELAADGDLFFTGGLGLGLGLQYDWNKMVFARGGFHLGTGNAPQPTYASLGLGVKFFGFHVDATWLTASKVLGNTLCIGLGYSF